MREADGTEAQSELDQKRSSSRGSLTLLLSLRVTERGGVTPPVPRFRGKIWLTLNQVTSVQQISAPN